MSDDDKRTRAELKSLFGAGMAPGAASFAALIDSGLNLVDDEVDLGGGSLKIDAIGARTSGATLSVSSAGASDVRIDHRLVASAVEGAGSSLSLSGSGAGVRVDRGLVVTATARTAGLTVTGGDLVVGAAGQNRSATVNGTLTLTGCLTATSGFYPGDAQTLSATTQLTANAVEPSGSDANANLQLSAGGTVWIRQPRWTRVSSSSGLFACFMDTRGIVHVRMVLSGSFENGTTLVTLPASFRPPSHRDAETGFESIPGGPRNYHSSGWLTVTFRLQSDGRLTIQSGLSSSTEIDSGRPELVAFDTRT